MRLLRFGDGFPVGRWSCALGFTLLSIAALPGCAGTEGVDVEQGMQAARRRSLPSIQKMWAEYPNGDLQDVKTLIGGAVDASWIENSCTIRLSRALNYSGLKIPRGVASGETGLRTVQGADKKFYAFRVSEFRKWLVDTVGRPTLVRTAEGGVDRTDFVGKKGIIAFTVEFSNATGHFDLWDGANAAHDDYFTGRTDGFVATKVELWEAPDDLAEDTPRKARAPVSEPLDPIIPAAEPPP